MTPEQVKWWAKVCLLLLVLYAALGAILVRACGG